MMGALSVAFMPEYATTSVYFNRSFRQSYDVQVRRISPPDPSTPFRAHGPTVLFWCLDPAFPGLGTIASLDLDGIMSNSRQALKELSELSYGTHHTLEYVPLAAQSDISQSTYPKTGGQYTERRGLSAEVEAAVAAARGKLVYVGSAGGIHSKIALVKLLTAAANATLPALHADSGVDEEASLRSKSAPPLVIFGARWDLVPEWAPYYAGVLPHEPGALAAVYQSAFAVWIKRLRHTINLALH